MTRSLWLVAALALAIGIFSDRLLARQPSATPAELLTEVRLLRRAIEALAGTNARVQIVFGRLQLQEQRTAAAVKRNVRCSRMRTSVGSCLGRCLQSAGWK